jgi:hypothetical protein
MNLNEWWLWLSPKEEKHRKQYKSTHIEKESDAIQQTSQRDDE